MTGKNTPLAESTSLSEALRRELAARAWPQKKLATLLKRNESTISLWLSGRQGPRIDDEATIVKLAKFLHSSPTEVRRLLAAQKEEPDDGGKIRAISSLKELEQIIARELPGLEEQAGMLTRTLAAGLKDRLLELGYHAEEDLFRKYLIKRQRLESADQGRPKGAGAPLAPECSSSIGGLPGPGRPAGLPDSFLVRDALRTVCQAVDRHFALSAKEELTAGEIAAVADAALAIHGKSGELAALREIAIEAWLNLKLLRETAPGVLQRRWPLHPEFVVNSILGVPTKISGLDFLLDGGLLPAVGSGLTLLIKGKAGAGKTMMALQLSASLACQGHLAVYLSAEENPDQLLGRLSYLGFAQIADEGPWRVLRREDNEQFSIMVSNYLTSEDGELVAQRLKGSAHGALLLVTIPNRQNLLTGRSKLIDHLGRLLREFAGRGLYCCCVFDSIDAVAEKGNRRLYEKLFGLTKHPRTIGVFLAELSAQLAAPVLRDHLADVVIRLDYRQRVESYIERILEIEKCRNQSHIRGPHMFAIHSRRGVTVYPSVQALLSVWRRRVRRKLPPQEVEPWSLPPDLDLDSVLQGDIVRGSTILLTGPPATHKFALGLSFLAAGLEAQPESQALLISLREDEAAVERIIRVYPQFRVLLNDQAEAGLSPRLRVLHFPPDYFSAERFIHWMQRTLREMQGTGTPVSRVLFSSLNQLLHNSPMFSREELFVDALLELFRKEQITSLFIGVGGERQREVQSAFDTIIFTDIKILNDEERIVMRVGHSGPCNAKRVPLELVRISEGGLGRLMLRPLIDST